MVFIYIYNCTLNFILYIFQKSFLMTFIIICNNIRVNNCTVTVEKGVSLFDENADNMRLSYNVILFFSNVCDLND